MQGKLVYGPSFYYLQNDTIKMYEISKLWNFSYGVTSSIPFEIIFDSFSF